MATAYVNFKCHRCGASVERTKQFNSVRDATRYEKWAEQNMTMCNKCYRAHILELEAKQAASIIESLSMPQILVGSDDDVAIAHRNRNKFLIDYCREVERYAAVINALEKQELERTLENAQAQFKLPSDKHKIKYTFLLLHCNDAAILRKEIPYIPY